MINTIPVLITQFNSSGKATFFMEQSFCYLLTDVASPSQFVCRIMVFLLSSQTGTRMLLVFFLPAYTFSLFFKFYRCYFLVGLGLVVIDLSA